MYPVGRLLYSKQLQEESIKLKLPLGYDELFVGDVADMFGGTKSGYKVSSKLFKINEQKRLMDTHICQEQFQYYKRFRPKMNF